MRYEMVPFLFLFADWRGKGITDLLVWVRLKKLNYSRASTNGNSEIRELKHWRRRRQGRRLGKNGFKFYSRIS